MHYQNLILVLLIHIHLFKNNWSNGISLKSEEN